MAIPGVVLRSGYSRFMSFVTMSFLLLPTGSPVAQSLGVPQTISGCSNSCDFCLASQGISPLEVGSSGIRIDLRYLRVGTAYLNGRKTVNNNNELETHLTQQYSIFYALSSRFTVSALIPVPKRYSEQLADEGSMILGNQFGLGDISLLVRYKPLVSHSVEGTEIFSLTAGLKLPTGRTDGKDSQGNLLDAHIQLGTGSTDFLAGVSGFMAWERTALIANILGGLTTKGANAHEFGNSLNYDVAFRYKVYPVGYEETQLFATLGINGEWRGGEIQDGLLDENSGGNVTYIAPGLQLFLSPAISFEATFQYPLLHGLHGQQLGEDFRLLSGIQLLL